MKAAELLRLYEAGRRDFNGESLRGQNFRGKDLSGADFSGADIRSANFTNANLTKANFTQAKAGLQRRWAAGLVVVSLLLSVASGVFLSSTSFVIWLIFDSSRLESQVLGWVALALVVIFLFGLLRKGIEVLVGSVAVAVAVASVFAGAVASVVTLVVAASGSLGTVAGSVAVIAALDVVGSLALVVAVAVTSVGYGALVLVLALALALAVTLVSAYVGWRALKGDERDVWIRSIAIAIAAIGGTSFRGATLTDADFSQARLKSSDFRRSVLLRTRWQNAEKLDHVRPGETYLNNLKIQKLLLMGDGQGQAFDYLLNLQGINLQGANLIKADFTGSSLKDGNLQGANLANASLIGANLNGVNLQDADLSNARLVQVQLDQANLTGATLTGAYIEDWNITTRTQLNGIRCDYVFMRLPLAGFPDPNPHRKPDDWQKAFAEGEFTDFITPLVETLDLYHNQTVDPRAVAVAFSDLRKQNPDADLEIVSMEKRGKNRDKFLIRAETTQQADLSQLSSQYFERYEHLLTLPPQAIQALLIEKEKQVQMLAGMVGTAINRPGTHINTYQNQGDTTVTEQGSDNPKYDMRGAQFGGGYVAGNVEGDQIGGTINNYGAKLDDISRLIASLRELAQSFPAEQKDDVLMELDDIEADIQKPQPDQKRIGQRLKRLAAIATTAAAITGGAATFSGDLNDFAGNVIELTETLGIPIEQVQPGQMPPANAP